MIRTTIVGYGETSIRLAETYIYRLDDQLSIYYPGICWSTHNALLKTATSKEMLSHLKDKVLNHNPNIVFINLSSYDSCTALDQLIGLKEFEENLNEIICIIKGHNNRTGLNGCIPIPLIITPPPVNETVAGIMRTNNRIKQYSDVINEVAKKHKCALVNLFDVISSKEEYITYLAEDGFSLNQKGHDLLYDLVFMEFTKLINYQGVLKDRDVIREDEF